MITVICLWWIGMRISAPLWYYALLAIGLVLHLIDAVRTSNERKKIRHL